MDPTDAQRTSDHAYALTPVLPAARRVIISELGEDPLDTLDHHCSLVATTSPDPAQLSPRDVIIEIASASVGWVDLLMLSGQYQHAVRPPYTPGLEYAGTVAWAGRDAAIAVGDRVLVFPATCRSTRHATSSATTRPRTIAW